MSDWKSLEYRIEDNRIVIYGDTFKNKEKIKSIGAKYNGKEKNWFLTKNKKNLELVKKLCDGCNKEVGSNGRSSYIIDYGEIDSKRLETSNNSYDIDDDTDSKDELSRMKKELKRILSNKEKTRRNIDQNQNQNINTYNNIDIEGVSRADDGYDSDVELELDSLFKAPTKKYLNKINSYSIESDNENIEQKQDQNQDQDVSIGKDLDDIDAISVSKLMNNIELIIKQVYSYPIWIYGEVQNISFRSSGIFFELVEPKGSSSSGVYSVKALIWNKDNLIIKEKEKIDLQSFLKDGIKLRLCAEVSFYKDRSYISLIVKRIDANYTKGQIALKREMLIKELKKKGVFNKNKELSLPRFPFRIGLISSYKSRAYSDFTHQLFSYGFCGEVLFYNARVQGEDSIKDIIKGIKVLNEKEVDLIVITRGGGSLSDLMWFDSESIVYSIVESKIPILSAIGHHDDESVAEEVSYRREKTPTAAADFIISIFNETDSIINECIYSIEEEFDNLYENCIETISGIKIELERAVSYFISTNTLKISSLEKDLFSKCLERIYFFKHYLEKYRSKLLSATDNFLNKTAISLNSLESRIFQNGYERIYFFESCLEKYKSLISNGIILFFNAQLQKLEEMHYKIVSKDPRPWLEKGYLNIIKKDPYTEEKKVIKSVNSIQVKDIVESHLIDGSLVMEVKEIKSKK